jgi:hypothetical protein
VWKQVETLKQHSDMLPDESSALLVEPEVPAENGNAALLVSLQLVDAADQGRFPRSRRTADHDDFLLGNLQGNILQDVELIEPLIQPIDVDGNGVAAC